MPSSGVTLHKWASGGSTSSSRTHTAVFFFCDWMTRPRQISLSDHEVTGSYLHIASVQAVRAPNCIKCAAKMWDFEVDLRLKTKQTNIHIALAHTSNLTCTAAFPSTDTHTHTSVSADLTKDSEQQQSMLFLLDGDWFMNWPWLRSSNKSPLKLQ